MNYVEPAVSVAALLLFPNVVATIVAATQYLTESEARKWRWWRVRVRCSGVVEVASA